MRGEGGGLVGWLASASSAQLEIVNGMDNVGFAYPLNSKTPASVGSFLQGVHEALISSISDLFSAIILSLVVVLVGFKCLLLFELLVLLVPDLMSMQQLFVSSSSSCRSIESISTQLSSSLSGIVLGC